MLVPPRTDTPRILALPSTLEEGDVVGAVRVVAFPTSDSGFAAAVEAAIGRLVPQDGGTELDFAMPDPGDVETFLRLDYPRCVVRPRLGFTEVSVDRRPTWYAYRDGGAAPHAMAQQVDGVLGG